MVAHAKRNNAKARRERKEAARVRGNVGTPSPAGSREYRRSPEGRARIAQFLRDLADKMRAAQ